MLTAAAMVVLAGLAAIAFGIPNKEFSIGGLLIQSGTLGVCSGLILFGLYAVLGELKVISSRLRQRGPESEVRPLQLPGLGSKADLEPAPVPPAEDAWREGGSPRSRPRMPDLSSPLSSAPLSQAPLSPPLPSSLRTASAADQEADDPVAEPAERPRRNLLFASTSRRERERAEKRAGEPMPTDFRSPPLSEPPSIPLDEPASEPASSGLDDTWSRPERARPPESLRPPFPRRLARAAPAFEPEPAPAPEPQDLDTPPASIIKSGVVDGMAYSLYSDGSIEAQMPEGMMRFASIDELRTHLEGRS
ncbi:hypothetical protein SSBR45G_38630 [Bradyrhizobium sp. SSBR45G]|nr:hypothetical protein SSBR45G_38630 [Bradyrhizobium sp. SSBR45G]GLH85277.1 hypothetical protein SSBR45R_27370 [Bradyrhizobium sp. SSBR45R]